MTKNLWGVRVVKGAAFFAVSLLVLTLFRLFFFFYFRSSDISFESFIPAFLMGIRIDAKWLGILCLPAWAALIFSFRWEKAWTAAKILGGIAQLLAVMLALINIGFFTFYGTPISPVIFGFLQDDTKAIVLTLLKDWPIMTYLAATILATMLPFLCSSLIRCKECRSVNTKTFAGIGIFGTIFMLVLIRGSFGTFPLRHQDLTVSPSAFVNSTIPNGMSALYQANKGQNLLKFKGGRRGGLREMGFSDVEEPMSVMKSHRSVAQMPSSLEKPRHVVMAIMESMGRELFDLHQPGNNMLGELEYQLEDAVLFRHGIAVGSGTFSSVEGLLFNTPLSPLTQTKYGRKPFDFSHVFKYKNAGYRTVFLTAGPEKWRQLDETFSTQGFDEIIGSSVIHAKYPQAELGTWGVADEWMFRYGAELLEESDRKGEKLFLVMLSVTNHPPFKVPDNYELKPIDTTVLPEYVVADRMSEKTIVPFQTYQYSCNALGEFIRTIREKGILARSLVAATGDHNARFYKYHAEGNWHHALGIPVMFWLPENQKALSKDVDTERWVTHVDVFPTLNALALGKAPGYQEGRNLFVEKEFDMALTYFGLGKKGFAIGNWGVVSLEGGGSLSCYRWSGDRLVNELPCSDELTEIGKVARAQRALADYEIRKNVLKK